MEPLQSAQLSLELSLGQLAAMLHWVRLSKYCELSGDTRDAVDKRLRSGHWLRDVHARKPEGSSELWINMAAVNDWASGKPPPHLHGTLGDAANAPMRRTHHQAPPTKRGVD